MNSRTILYSFLSLGAVFGLFFAVARELMHLENCFDADKLVLYSALAGLPFAALVFGLFQNKIADKADKYRVLASLTLLCLILFPLAGSVSNRWLASPGIHPVKVILLKQTPYYAGRFGLPAKDKLTWTGYYTFVVYLGNTERLSSRSPLFDEQWVGSEMELSMKKGFWGYYFLPLQS